MNSCWPLLLLLLASVSLLALTPSGCRQIDGYDDMSLYDAGAPGGAPRVWWQLQAGLQLRGFSFAVPRLMSRCRSRERTSSSSRSSALAASAGM